jgi:predicted RNase H-like HicB family nuclease
MTKSCSVFSRISHREAKMRHLPIMHAETAQSSTKANRIVFLCELAFWHEKHPLQAGGVKNESVSRHYRADQNWTVGLLAGSTGCLATGATGEEVEKEMYDAIEFHLEGLRLEVNPFRCHGGKRRIARSS